MKKIAGLLICLLLAAACAAALAEVPVDEGHFPDAVFRKYVSDSFDKDGNGSLDEAEVTAAKEVILYNKDVQSMEGVKLLTNLRYLSCSSNPLGTLDVSGMTSLEKMDCCGSQLESLKIAGCSGLTKVSCYQNSLEKLDLTGCTALKELTCDRNQLKSLDVSGAAALEKLDCGTNQLTNLDVSSLTALTDLTCHTNQLTDLDVSNCGQLNWLLCSGNSLTRLDLRSCRQISKVECDHNRLTEILLEGCDELYWLSCAGNRLTNIDVCGKQQLMYVGCDHNDIAVLDLSGCRDGLIGMARKKPELRKDLDGIEYLHFPDHGYSGWGTGEQIVINRDTAITANGETLYNPPPSVRDCKITGVKNIRYREAFPLPEIRYGDKLLERYQDYDLQFTGVGTVGRASITVVGKNEYCGSVVLEFTILPQKISKVTVEGLEDRVYTGKALKPALTLKYVYGSSYLTETLEEGKNYTLAWKNNREIGKAAVTITGKGDYYTGTVKKTFRILPKAVKLTGLTAGKGTLTVKWKKGTGGITGYQVEYGLKEDFSDAKKVSVKDAATVSAVLKKLKAKQAYWVRIRVYKKIGSKTYWSVWSAARKKTVK